MGGAGALKGGLFRGFRGWMMGEGKIQWDFFEKGEGFFCVLLRSCAEGCFAGAGNAYVGDIFTIQGFSEVAECRGGRRVGGFVLVGKGIYRKEFIMT